MEETAELALELRARGARRVLLAMVGILLLSLLAVLPPLLQLGRYQRRITVAMSGVLGRPVHFDRIQFHLLPLPGLTIENFVVTEDPHFGAEPALRANRVEARLRLGSLWRRRVEISRIDLQAPSVNLVHARGGEWNLAGVLTQASRLQTAPTAQRGTSYAPRFPYIQATDARVNIKMGEDKLPFSVTGATFALWLPSPDEWHIRMAGKPVRTDTDVSDVGELQMEGTLGRAVNLPAAAVALHLHWKPTPLGEASKMMTGADAGWRGEMSGSAELEGRLEDATLKTDVFLREVRRADFVPAHSLQVDAHCEGRATGVLHSIRDIRCVIPTEESGPTLLSLLAAKKETAAGSGLGEVNVTAEIPTTMDWGTAEVHLRREGAPEYWTEWLRLFSQRIPAELRVDGRSTVQLDRSPGPQSGGTLGVLMECRCEISGVPKVPARPSELRTVPEKISPAVWPVYLTGEAGADSIKRGELLVSAAANDETFDRAMDDSFPPGANLVKGILRSSGYQLSYASGEVARRMAEALPPLGDGMPVNASGPMIAERRWGGGQPQTWTAGAVPAERRKRRR